MKTTQQNVGSNGEKLAADFLESLGYVILEKNYRFGRNEVDLIAQDNQEHVFIEVKTRKSAKFGNPEQFVSEAQQKRLIECANHYAMTQEITTSIRFDIISITGKPPHHQVTHFIDAFWPMA